MKIVKIKNKYMFHSKNPNAEHIYLHYYDRKAKETRLVETTHLYEIPIQKKKALKKGYMQEVKFKDLYLPSGVDNNYYTTDIKGRKLPYKQIGTVTNKQAHKVKSFLKFRHK